MTLRPPLPLRVVPTLAVILALALGACGPSLDDDDSTPPDFGRVTVQPGGMVFDSIQEAIDAAAEGATITVSAGVYDESLQINKALTLSGADAEQTIVTGNGDGTILEIDQVAGSVQINGLALVAPADEPGTIRGLRITDSDDVLLHDLRVGFDDRGNSGECVHGLVGVDVSASTVVMSETFIYCVGFTSETGGAGILSQTGSDLTVVDSSIGAVGSFGIRSLSSALAVSDTAITSVNRPPSAEQYESDGTAIFIEQSNEEVVLDRVVLSDGSFVGVWMEGPSLTVTNSDFSSFPYGVYLPGDSAIASGRQLIVTGSSFSDIMQEAVLSVASTTITGSSFRTNGLLVDPSNGSTYSGVRVIAPQGEAVITANVFENLGVRGVTVVGNNDGNVASATVSFNTISGITAGNGVMVSDADIVVIEDNVITGIDHAYFDDDGGPNAGAITNGFGIACFRATSCTLSGNDISDAEFANVVISTSNFNSTNDIFRDGWGRGIQIESSQGTITNGTFENNRGVGIVMISSTVSGIGGSFRGTVRGPSFIDLDGVDDPAPEDLMSMEGGRAIESLASGGSAFLSWSNAVFEDNILGAVYSSGGQFEFTGNRLTNNGYDDPITGMGGGAAIVVSGIDELALSGPLIDSNIVDGCEGSWAVSLSEAPGARVQNNTVCGGSSAGIYLTRSDGAVISGNSLGSSTDPSVTYCDGIEWTYALYLNQNDPSQVSEGVTISGNLIGSSDAAGDDDDSAGDDDDSAGGQSQEPASMSYGIYISGVGPYSIENNEIYGGSVAGISATLTLPAGLTWDDDGDSRAEYQGDCDDTNPLVGAWPCSDSNSTTQQACEDAGFSWTDRELPGDGLDNDCDGLTDEDQNGPSTSTTDADGDSFSIADGDCNDTNPAVYPGALEVVGNFFDDNCDGWAEFDGAFPAPELTLEGNLISGARDGIRLNGATLTMPAVAGGDDPNDISGALGTGIYTTTWLWSGTPASVPGTVAMGAGNVIADSAESCIHLAGVGNALTIDGVTLSRCGQWGIYLSGDGTVDATDVVVDEPNFSGIRLLNGLATLDGFEVDSPNNSGIEVLGGVLAASNVEVNDAGSSALVVMGGSGSLDSLVANFMGSQGVSMSSGTFALSNSAIGGAVAAGVAFSGGDLSITGGSVSNSGQGGIEATGGTLTIDGTSIHTNAGDGILLTGSVIASVSNTTLDDNGGYGLTCDGGSPLQLLSCSSQSSGNPSGDFSQINGCESQVTCSLLTP
jgi:parallel beta-helix repeat protein